MKFSEQWLREWINPSTDIRVIAEQLTMAGLEVESIVPVAGDFSGVVIGRIISVEPHPNAQRLHFCRVDIGNTILDIICGGVNVKEKLCVPVAKIGALLPGHFKIKKAKLRGMPSHGMICSRSELGLGEDLEGHIMELRQDAPIGVDLRDYLDLEDHIVEIGLTPNRGDCCSIRGIARDLAVINQTTMAPHSITPQPIAFHESFPVTVEAMAACPRYVGRVIRDINLGAAVTPLWMEERLRRSGLNSLHPVVDVLNYVMLEIGQPLHAFDLDQINGSITVRYSKKGEKLILLNGQKVTLPSGNLIISDQSQALAIAGVMGGLQSGVTESSCHLFLESAFFEPIQIRQSAKYHGLQTDAAYRFERGVDFNLQVDAIERATELLLSLVGGQAGPIIEKVSKDYLPKEKIITFCSQEINRLLGISIQNNEVERILIALGMDLRPVMGGWVVAVPSYRFDLECEADLVEEVARVYGYDQIPAKPMIIEGNMPKNPERYISDSRIANFLVSQGYFEAITYSFTSQEKASLFNSKCEKTTLSNPMSKDMAIMRPSVLTGLLQAVQYNQHRQASRVRLFEMGLSFTQSKKQLQQTPKLAIVAAGTAYPEQWAFEKRTVDFYDLKGLVEKLLAQTGNVSAFHWVSGEHPALHPGQRALLYYKNEAVGYLGLLHPELVQRLELQSTVCCFEIELSVIQQRSIPSYKKRSKFPALRRDIAIIVNQATPVETIRTHILDQKPQFLTKIEIFDIYQGRNIEKGKKSVALGLTFQNPSRTLVDTEINDVIQDVVGILERGFNAKLRAS